MTERNRREFLGTLAKSAGAATVGSALPSSIQRALAVPANRRTGTLQDVEHIVVLTQENRSFDHYFGALAGVRGFADPFPVPVADRPAIVSKSVWYQPNAAPEGSAAGIVPFRLNTEQHFEYTRVEGAPHTWSDAQSAWNEGRLNQWPLAKQNHSMGYFARNDIPYQWALAEAFTLCDAYHCASQTGTNTNRLFIWTGTNDGLAQGNGPATDNDYEWFDGDPGRNGGYAWTTYAERLQQAGVTWQVYQNLADNFADNPLAGFRTFRDAWFQRPGYSEALRDRGVTSRDLDLLKEDVLADRLPQVSWIVATAEGSEHPEPSSPAQGAAYTARVLEALTANAEVWSKTVLLINFDENDGFFDHMPPPAPPSYVTWDKDPSRAVLAGASTVDTKGEYHEHLVSYHSGPDDQALLHRPYGLGPRVPLYVVSPWSKGGWVCSQVFDHTSVIRFIEARFGVHEPNISPWRRAVCGDLLTAFDFADPDDGGLALPETLERATRARALPQRKVPPIPEEVTLPVQERGVRPSRALPYALHTTSQVMHDARIKLTFANTGGVGAVFHVYNRLDLEATPRRYTVGAGKSLGGFWHPGAAGAYDLWVLGPNGYHRHFIGNATRAAEPAEANPDGSVSYDPDGLGLKLRLTNTGGTAVVFVLTATRYGDAAASYPVAAQSSVALAWPLGGGPWYDLSLTVDGDRQFKRRFAGRLETGSHSVSDPHMAGGAVGDQA